MVVKHVLFRSNSGPLSTTEPFEDVNVSHPIAKSYTFGLLEYKDNLPPEVTTDNLEDLPILESSPSSGSKPELLNLIVSALDSCLQRQGLENHFAGALADNFNKQDVHRPTSFHGARPPPISIPAYLCRIAKYTKCSPVCFVIGLIYLDNIASKHTDYLPGALSVHRLILTGVMLAAKFCDDHYFNNTFFAKVGGVSLSDLNRMEKEMLQLLKFRLLCRTEGIRTTVKRLQRGAYVIGVEGQATSILSGLDSISSVVVIEGAISGSISDTLRGRVSTASSNPHTSPSMGRKRRSNSGNNGDIERRTHQRGYTEASAHNNVSGAATNSFNAVTSPTTMTTITTAATIKAKSVVIGPTTTLSTISTTTTMVRLDASSNPSAAAAVLVIDGGGGITKPNNSSTSPNITGVPVAQSPSRHGGGHHVIIPVQLPSAGALARVAPTIRNTHGGGDQTESVIANTIPTIIIDAPKTNITSNIVDPLIPLKDVPGPSSDGLGNINNGKNTTYNSNNSIISNNLSSNKISNDSSTSSLPPSLPNLSHPFNTSAAATLLSTLAPPCTSSSSLTSSSAAGTNSETSSSSSLSFTSSSMAPAITAASFSGSSALVVNGGSYVASSNLPPFAPPSLGLKPSLSLLSGGAPSLVNPVSQGVTSTSSSNNNPNDSNNRDVVFASPPLSTAFESLKAQVKSAATHVSKPSNQIPTVTSVLPPSTNLVNRQVSEVIYNANIRNLNDPSHQQHSIINQSFSAGSPVSVFAVNPPFLLSSPAKTLISVSHTPTSSIATTINATAVTMSVAAVSDGSGVFCTPHSSGGGSGISVVPPPMPHAKASTSLSSERFELKSSSSAPESRRSGIYFPPSLNKASTVGATEMVTHDSNSNAKATTIASKNSAKNFNKDNDYSSNNNNNNNDSNNNGGMFQTVPVVERKAIGSSLDRVVAFSEEVKSGYYATRSKSFSGRSSVSLTDAPLNERKCSLGERALQVKKSGNEEGYKKERLRELTLLHHSSCTSSPKPRRYPLFSSFGRLSHGAERSKHSAPALLREGPLTFWDVDPISNSNNKSRPMSYTTGQLAMDVFVPNDSSINNFSNVQTTGSTYKHMIINHGKALSFNQNGDDVEKRDHRNVFYENAKRTGLENCRSNSGEQCSTGNHINGREVSTSSSCSSTRSIESDSYSYSCSYSDSDMSSNGSGDSSNSSNGNSRSTSNSNSGSCNYESDTDSGSGMTTDSYNKRHHQRDDVMNTKDSNIDNGYLAKRHPHRSRHRGRGHPRARDDIHRESSTAVTRTTSDSSRDLDSNNDGFADDEGDSSDRRGVPHEPHNHPHHRRRHKHHRRQRPQRSRSNSNADPNVAHSRGHRHRREHSGNPRERERGKGMSQGPSHTSPSSFTVYPLPSHPHSHSSFHSNQSLRDQSAPHHPCSSTTAINTAMVNSASFTYPHRLQEPYQRSDAPPALHSPPSKSRSLNSSHNSTRTNTAAMAKPPHTSAEAECKSVNGSDSDAVIGGPNDDALLYRDKELSTMSFLEVRGGKRSSSSFSFGQYCTSSPSSRRGRGEEGEGRSSFHQPQLSSRHSSHRHQAKLQQQQQSRDFFMAINNSRGDNDHGCSYGNGNGNGNGGEKEREKEKSTKGKNFSVRRSCYSATAIIAPGLNGALFPPTLSPSVSSYHDQEQQQLRHPRPFTVSGMRMEAERNDGSSSSAMHPVSVGIAAVSIGHPAITTSTTSAYHTFSVHQNLNSATLIPSFAEPHFAISSDHVSSSPLSSAASGNKGRVVVGDEVGGGEVGGGEVGGEEGGGQRERQKHNLSMNNVAMNGGISNNHSSGNASDLLSIIASSSGKKVYHRSSTGGHSSSMNPSKLEGEGGRGASGSGVVTAAATSVGGGGASGNRSIHRLSSNGTRHLGHI